MNLMDRQGHLTEEALLGLAEGGLCEAQRVEVAEHLTLCDSCLVRMATLDENELPLRMPAHDLVQPTMRQLHRRKLIYFGQRCAIVAAAACFMLVSWGQGTFGRAPQLPQQGSAPGLLQKITLQLSDSLSCWGDEFSQMLQESFEKAPATL